MQAAASNDSDASGEVLVENMPPDAYIEKFKWNEAKYPPRRPLSETVNTITETVSKLEEDLKVPIMLAITSAPHPQIHRSPPHASFGREMLLAGPKADCITRYSAGKSLQPP